MSTTVDARVRPYRVEISDKELGDLLSFNQVDRGGHFAAWEQPTRFSAELHTAFRTLRSR